jgi:hypothetical protein
MVVLTILAIFFRCGSSQVIDLRTNKEVSEGWLDSGFLSVGEDWIAVTSTYAKFVDPIVFLR